jgi:hypothetical protein
MRAPERCASDGSAYAARFWQFAWRICGIRGNDGIGDAIEPGIYLGVAAISGLPRINLATTPERELPWSRPRKPAQKCRGNESQLGVHAVDLFGNGKALFAFGAYVFRMTMFNVIEPHRLFRLCENSRFGAAYAAQHRGRHPSLHTRIHSRLMKWLQCAGALGD